MNAPSSDIPPPELRRLSPAVEERLIAALAGHLAEPSDASMAGLTEALHGAATDGRERGLRAEELLLVFKDVEAKAEMTLPKRGNTGESARRQLIHTLLEAYYRTR